VNDNPATEKREGQKQREAIESSERNASAQQPENFRDEAIDEKVVEIKPDKTANPIKGLDPAEPTRPKP
jgi:hypothetical protein